MGMAFPLFTNQMYAALTYKWANTLFGCLAALMAPIPFVRDSLQLQLLMPVDVLTV